MKPLYLLGLRLAALVLAGLAPAAACATTSAEFTNWPAGTAPVEVGRRVAENFVTRSFVWQTDPKARQIVIYREVCAWYGSLNYAALAGDQVLQRKLLAKYDILLTPEGADKISTKGHVDDRVFGAVPLELYRQTKDPKFLAAGLQLADAQWATPTPDGITSEARYWIDDMFMSPVLQLQAWRTTGEPKYLDRTARLMAAYLDKLQQPNGLFFHTADSPFFWGRGNGWVAAGLTELLRELPATHPQHGRILKGYHAMMSALLQTQGADGMWHQLLDKPESWAESSCTGMFTFAFVTGVKNGWLDPKAYAPAARTAWLALIGYLDADANLREVCIGTNKARQETKSDDLKVQYDYYLARPRRIGDLHGQAPLLWTAAAFLR